MFVFKSVFTRCTKRQLFYPLSYIGLRIKEQYLVDIANQYSTIRPSGFTRASNIGFQEEIESLYQLGIKFPNDYLIASKHDWMKNLSLDDKLPSTDLTETILKNHVCSHLEQLIGKYSFEHQGFKLALKREVNTKEGEMPSKFLARNFKFVSTGKADIVLYLFHMDQKIGGCPVVVGEVKKKLDDPQKVFNQLFIYQLACQRPYLLNSSSSRLIGFLLDYTEGYIIELSIGLWTDENPVQCLKVERYLTKTQEQLIDFLCTIFDRLAKGLKTVDLTQLTKPQSPTIRFPPVGTLLDKCTHILKLNSIEMKSVISPIISSFGEYVQFSYGDASSLGSLEPGTQLLFKVCGSTISGGINKDHFAQFLNCVSGNLEYLKTQYIAIVKLSPNHPFVFTVARYIEGEDCSSSSVATWWMNNRSLARELFFSDVYQVALNALRIGYFHWDIRPPNILLNLNEGRAKFFVIDWDSAARPDTIMGRLSGFATPNLRMFLKIELKQLHPSARAAVILCEQLMMCLSHWEKDLSPTWFLHELEKNSSELASKRSLDSVLPLLNRLMQQALSCKLSF